jgi:hypothetical protein
MVWTGYISVLTHIHVYPEIKCIYSAHDPEHTFPLWIIHLIQINPSAQNLYLVYYSSRQTTLAPAWNQSYSSYALMTAMQ